jgi:hypothetical protein
MFSIYAMLLFCHRASVLEYWRSGGGVQGTLENLTVTLRDFWFRWSSVAGTRDNEVALCTEGTTGTNGNFSSNISAQGPEMLFTTWQGSSITTVYQEDTMVLCHCRLYMIASSRAALLALGIDYMLLCRTYPEQSKMVA